MPKHKKELIDARVSLKQCRTAVDALLAHAQQKEKELEETELLPGKEQHVWVQVTVKKMHPEKKLKPFKIPITHPLVDPRTSAVCLITKDPQREYKDLLDSHGIKFISRVVGIVKLKGKFKPFEARRLLLKENAMFLADERVIPLLPGLLGKKWFDAKKQPIPVCLTRKDLKGELERAISSTYMHQNQGTCISIKIGTVAQSSAQILANLQTALPPIVQNIKDGWNNVQSIGLKTNSSVTLPLWTCSLNEDAGGRWDGLITGTDERVETKVVSDNPVATNSKRRVEENGEDIKPKKKAKATERQLLITPSDTVSKSVLSKPSEELEASSDPIIPVVQKKRTKTAGVDSPVKNPLAQLGNSTTSSRTNELKKKRSAGSRESKKEKVLSGKPRRSAKGAVLGKKIALG